MERLSSPELVGRVGHWGATPGVAQQGSLMVLYGHIPPNSYPRRERLAWAHQRLLSNQYRFEDYQEKHFGSGGGSQPPRFARGEGGHWQGPGDVSFRRGTVIPPFPGGRYPPGPPLRPIPPPGFSWAPPRQPIIPPTGPPLRPLPGGGLTPPHRPGIYNPPPGGGHRFASAIGASLEAGRFAGLATRQVQGASFRGTIATWNRSNGTRAGLISGASSVSVARGLASPVHLNTRNAALGSNATGPGWAARWVAAIGRVVSRASLVSGRVTDGRGAAQVASQSGGSAAGIVSGGG